MWPISLEQPLPVVPIPLLPGDPAVPLDLQQALAVVYDIIGYDELVDYTRPPPGPLSAAESAWVEERLRGGPADAVTDHPGNSDATASFSSSNS